MILNSFPVFHEAGAERIWDPVTTTIKFQLPLSKTSDIIVFYILGEEVMRQHISSPFVSVELNISSLAKGAYFGVVRNEREVFTSKFIKQ
jgi:hypothetical protein